MGTQGMHVLSYLDTLLKELLGSQKTSLQMSSKESPLAQELCVWAEYITALQWWCSWIFVVPFQEVGRGKLLLNMTKLLHWLNLNVFIFFWPTNLSSSVFWLCRALTRSGCGLERVANGNCPLSWVWIFKHIRLSHTMVLSYGPCVLSRCTRYTRCGLLS